MNEQQITSERINEFMGLTPELRRMYLAQRQSLPLNVKINLSKRRIQDWYEYHNGMVYVAFSGGKDSTVLLHLVRSMYPDVPAVFSDTGLEYPEIREFVSTTENVVWSKPRKNFKAVIDEDGYPLISKQVAKSLRRVQNPTDKNEASRTLALTGIKRDGTKSPFFKLPKKYMKLIDSGIKVSEKCCDYMKKYPARDYEKSTKRKAFTGVMAQDSRSRQENYIRVGCNSYTSGTSQPLAFWLEQDVWGYIKRFDVPYASIYDKGETRTGCVFCMFGMEFDKDRFVRLKKLHPQLHSYCMDKLKMREVLQFMGYPTGDEDESHA